MSIEYMIRYFYYFFFHNYIFLIGLIIIYLFNIVKLKLKTKLYQEFQQILYFVFKILII